MTVGIPDDMRRTGFVSLVGHLVLLAALTAVPLFKVSSPGAVSYQVTLVSPAPRPAVSPAPAPAAPTPKPVERPVTEPVKSSAPAPPVPVRVTVAPPSKSAPPAPLLASKARERMSESFKETLQKVALTKEVRQVAVPIEPREPGPGVSGPVARPVPQPPKSPPPADVDVNELLRKADESLSKPPVVPVAQPAVPARVPPTAPRMSEDIGKLLSTLPPPVTVPTVSKPAGPLKDPSQAAAALRSPTASRAATVERCPPKALQYCPILQAAINRAWNADTNPDVRQVLESAGSATVLVRIVIQPNGEVREIRMNGSSGNEAYDRAVQSVLREIRTLPPLPEEMKGEPFVAVTSFTYAKKQDS
jgi:TonB family protein